jgi:hypothetical protein
MLAGRRPGALQSRPRLRSAGLRGFLGSCTGAASTNSLTSFVASVHRSLSTGKRAVNTAHAKIRAVGEQAMATLKGWRLLCKLRSSTNRITDVVKSVLALHLAST